MVSKENAVEILKRQIQIARELRDQPRFCPQFNKWCRDTQIAIERIFSKNTRHTSDFDSISYSLSAFGSETTDYEFTEAFQNGLDNARVILQSMIDEIEEYGLDERGWADVNPITIVERLCNRFHLVARQLRSRHQNKPTLEVEDEYDVQDLLHALLQMNFDDIRPEEWTPSYAGSSSRMDFLLKQEQIVIEAKKTRKNLGAKEVGEHLIIDIKKYRNHPDCKLLICFVYDPEGRIANPRGIENDLNKDHEGLKVLVIIAPKGA
jgi:hypothetical protein